MSDNYNNILMEHKVYKEEKKTNKHPKFTISIIIAILISILIIIISYLIYYKTVLTNENIYTNDIKIIFDKYTKILDKTKLNYDLKSDYTLAGNVLVNQNKYNYTIASSGKKTLNLLENNNQSIKYYEDGDNHYFNINNSDEYIQITNELYNLDYYKNELKTLNKEPNTYLNNLFLESTITKNNQDIYNLFNYSTYLNNIMKNFKSVINSSNCKRKIYFDNKKPIIYLRTTLTNQNINKIFNISQTSDTDNYTVSLESKNDALTNDIKNIKIVINNQITKDREVIIYNGSNIIYTDKNDVKHKFTILTKDEITYLKYYKNDILYSVLTKARDDTNRYNYTYQVIDRVYNINLTINASYNDFSYNLKTNIDNNATDITITGTYKNKATINETIIKSIKYDNLEDDVQAKYNQKLSTILFGK